MDNVRGEVLSQVKFEGILPAVVTPLDSEERFAPKPYEQLLKRMFGAGSHGLYVAGQTGEGLLLGVDERKRVTEESARLLPAGRTLIVHVGAYRTADAVVLARHAAASGAHAVSSLPPIGPWTFEEVRDYYKAIADASSLPVFVYYFPEVSPIIRTEDQINQLLSIPNVVGLKFTDFDLYRLSRLTLRGITVFNGRDEVLAAGMLMGAHGGIGTFYNLAPELFVKIYDCSRAGRWAEARDAQDKVNELIAILLRYPLIASVKQVLSWLGLECGPCAGPRRRELTAEEATRLRAELKASSLPHLAG